MNIKLKTALVTLALSSLVLVHTPASANDLLVTKPSKFSVAETLDKLTAVLTKKGITVFTRVDHAAGAKKVGKELLPTQLLIFGNPKLGTPLMAANRAIGLDLPMKALAWQDKDGKTWLSYTKPSALQARHAITGRDKVFETMAGALNNLTNAATGNAN